MVRRLIMGLIAAVAIGGIVYTFSGPTQSDDPDRPAAVEGVSPAGGNLDLRQVTISADLAPGYTGYLTMDGVEVPEDDLQRVDALNSVTLRPQPDSDYRELEPGPHCAGVVYWRIGGSQEESMSHRWCFRLH
ncbi:MAG: hypothetical protein ABR540_13435 [Acidimicrobiales bacterium]|nr:hypothetical protein [Actinomycetota bacterium]